MHILVRRILMLLAIGVFVSAPAVGATGGGQSQNVDQLREIVRDQQLRRHEPEKVARAIRELGELKAETAIPELVSALAFERKLYFDTPDAVDEIRLVTTGDRYPATSALFQIGRPALPALVRVIGSTEPKSIESKNATQVVSLIFRDDPHQGALYLKDAAEESPTSAAARRLKSASAAIEILVKKNPERHLP